MTRGAVYHHFGSKQGLFEAVLVDEQRSVARAVAEAAHGSGWAALEAGSLAFVRASTAPGVGRILLLDGPSVLGWEAWRDRDRETSGQLLIDGLRELPICDPRGGGRRAAERGDERCRPVDRPRR